jgi:hypothetical protein
MGSISAAHFVITFHITIPQADGNLECDCSLESTIPKDISDKTTKQMSLSNPLRRPQRTWWNAVEFCHLELFPSNFGMIPRGPWPRLVLGLWGKNQKSEEEAFNALVIVSGNVNIVKEKTIPHRTRKVSCSMFYSWYVSWYHLAEWISSR